jgi:hypothetical protein
MVFLPFDFGFWVLGLRCSGKFLKILKLLMGKSLNPKMFKIFYKIVE